MHGMISKFWDIVVCPFVCMSVLVYTVGQYLRHEDAIKMEEKSEEEEEEEEKREFTPVPMVNQHQQA